MACLSEVQQSQQKKIFKLGLLTCATRSGPADQLPVKFRPHLLVQFCFLSQFLDFIHESTQPLDRCFVEDHLLWQDLVFRAFQVGSPDECAVHGFFALVQSVREIWDVE